MKRNKTVDPVNPVIKKIGMVYCYIGKWPGYLRLFLESCKYNPSVDFLIFTDCGEPGEHSENVKIIPFTLVEFNTLASLKLGMGIEVKNPYKLCDFKPCYGVIFEDYIQKYEYWGYGDIDVVFGNIRKFITEYMLNNYDIITSGKEFLCGHFTLMRHSLKTNRLFENSIDYKKALQSDEYCSFDECHSWKIEAGMATIIDLRKGAYIFDCTTEIESMTHVVQRLYNKGDLTIHFKNLFRDGSDIRVDYSLYTFNYKWDKGRLTDVENGEEFLYVHLFGLKRNEAYNTISRWKVIPDSFIITKHELSEHTLFSREDQRKISLHYCKKYFPRTIILLSALSPDYIGKLHIADRSNQKTYKEWFTHHLKNNLKTYSFYVQDRLNEIFELEILKINLLEAVSAFGHFAHDLPKKDHLQGLKELDIDSEYSLHKDTRLVQTKWNWEAVQSEKEFIKNMNLPKGQFHVILAPTFFEVAEKQVSKSLFDLLQKFVHNNTLKNALNSLKKSKDILPGSEESELSEIELTEQFKELVLSGILLKSRIIAGSNNKHPSHQQEAFDEIILLRKEIDQLHRIREEVEFIMCQKLDVKGEQIQDLYEKNKKMQNSIKWYKETFEKRKILGIIKDRIVKNISGFLQKNTKLFQL